MIVEGSEIDRLEKLALGTLGGLESAMMSQKEHLIDYVARHPYLMFPAGFCEARIFRRGAPGAVEFLKAYLGDENSFDRPERHAFRGVGNDHELLIRRTSDAEWFALSWIREGGYRQPHLQLKGNSGQIIEVPSVKLCETLRSRGIWEPENVLWLPNVPLEKITKPKRAASAHLASQLLQTIRNGGRSLDDLAWTEFEDMVAQLMKDAGFQVLHTKYTRDGGRDLICRGELLPGILAEMAVEVTHRKVVGIDKLSHTLYRNKNFPLIMLVTSGRFSSGLLMEAGKPENSMRLLLRDGQSLRSWIKKTPSGLDH